MSGTKKYTILFVPVPGIGHLNACKGVACQLRDRGHKVVFATPNHWKGTLEPEGFVEELYATSDDPVQANWNEIFAKMAPTMAMTSVEQVEHFMYPILCETLKQFKYTEPGMKKIMEKVKPDAVIIDHAFHSPALMDSGVPWINSISVTPLGISSVNVPPAGSGYPTEGDQTLWKLFDKKKKEFYGLLFDDLKKWVVENGGPKLELKECYPHYYNYSPHANIYMYPEELDYTMYRPNPPNFYRFDAFVRSTNDIFELPEELKNSPGKLIYFSMGTWGCTDLSLMRRLIGILAKSPHRFIVSKGPMADQLTLPSNMWGAASLPQTKVIPLVDLVITHGGNNTITESFHFGKRVLVLPIFGDQWDNGQRIHETGLGLQFLPYKVTQEELLFGIEALLKDELLERRMISISKRIQSSNSQARAADVVENVARKYKSKN